MEVNYDAEPVAIEVDMTNCDSTSYAKLPIIATVAGQVCLTHVMYAHAPITDAWCRSVDTCAYAAA